MRFHEIAADRIYQLDHLTPPLARSVATLLDAIAISKQIEKFTCGNGNRAIAYDLLAQAAKALSAEATKIATHARRKQRSLERG